MVRSRKPRLRLGVQFWRITPSNWCPSTSSRCPRSVFRSFTSFWCWPMIPSHFALQCDRPPDRGVGWTATPRGISL
jgi:hypothetical protein